MKKIVIVFVLFLLITSLCVVAQEEVVSEKLPIIVEECGFWCGVGEFIDKFLGREDALVGQANLYRANIFNNFGLEFLEKSNYDSAIANFKEACNLGAEVACYNLGSTYEDIGSFVKAADAHNSACNVGYSDSCDSLPSVISKVGSKCFAGNGYSCYVMSHYYGTDEYETAEDYGQVKTYLDKGCDELGSGVACDERTKLFGVPKVVIEEPVEPTDEELEAEIDAAEPEPAADEEPTPEPEPAIKGIQPGLSPAEVENFLSDMCNIQDSASHCMELYTAYTTGKYGFPKDTFFANAYRNLACDKGDVKNGCVPANNENTQGDVFRSDEELEADGEEPDVEPEPVTVEEPAPEQEEPEPEPEPIPTAEPVSGDEQELDSYSAAVRLAEAAVENAKEIAQSLQGTYLESDADAAVAQAEAAFEAAKLATSAEEAEQHSEDAFEAARLVVDYKNIIDNPADQGEAAENIAAAEQFLAANKPKGKAKPQEPQKTANELLAELTGEPVVSGVSGLPAPEEVPEDVKATAEYQIMTRTEQGSITSNQYNQLALTDNQVKDLFTNGEVQGLSGGDRMYRDSLGNIHVYEAASGRHLLIPREGNPTPFTSYVKTQQQAGLFKTPTVQPLTMGGFVTKLVAIENKDSSVEANDDSPEAAQLADLINQARDNGLISNEQADEWLNGNIWDAPDVDTIREQAESLKKLQPFSSVIGDFTDEERLDLADGDTVVKNGVQYHFDESGNLLFGEEGKAPVVVPPTDNEQPVGGWYTEKVDSQINPKGAYGNIAWWKLHGEEGLNDWDVGDVSAEVDKFSKLASGYTSPGEETEMANLVLEKVNNPKEYYFIEKGYNEKNGEGAFEKMLYSELKGENEEKVRAALFVGPPVSAMGSSSVVQEPSSAVYSKPNVINVNVDGNEIPFKSGKTTIIDGVAYYKYIQDDGVTNPLTVFINPGTGAVEYNIPPDEKTISSKFDPNNERYKGGNAPKIGQSFLEKATKSTVVDAADVAGGEVDVISRAAPVVPTSYNPALDVAKLDELAKGYTNGDEENQIAAMVYNKDSAELNALQEAYDKEHGDGAFEKIINYELDGDNLIYAQGSLDALKEGGKWRLGSPEPVEIPVLQPQKVPLKLHESLKSGLSYCGGEGCDYDPDKVIADLQSKGSYESDTANYYSRDGKVYYYDAMNPGTVTVYDNTNGKLLEIVTNPQKVQAMLTDIKGPKVVTPTITKPTLPATHFYTPEKVSGDVDTLKDLAGGYTNGDEKNQIADIVTGKNPRELRTLQDAYNAKHGEGKFEEMLKDKLKSDNLQRATQVLANLNSASEIYSQGLNLYNEHRDVEAAALFNKGCYEHKDTASCNGLGILYKDGRIGGQPDYQKAHTLFLASCAAGDEKGCTNLASGIARGNFIGSYEESYRLFERGCKEGYGSACQGLAHMYFTGKGTGVSMQKSDEAQIRGCGLGYANSCKLLDEDCNSDPSGARCKAYQAFKASGKVPGATEGTTTTAAAKEKPEEKPKEQMDSARPGLKVGETDNMNKILGDVACLDRASKEGCRKDANGDPIMITHSEADDRLVLLEEQAEKSLNSYKESDVYKVYQNLQKTDISKLKGTDLDALGALLPGGKRKTLTPVGFNAMLTNLLSNNQNLGEGWSEKEKEIRAKYNLADGVLLSTNKNAAAEAEEYLRKNQGITTQESDEAYRKRLQAAKEKLSDPTKDAEKELEEIRKLRQQNEWKGSWAEGIKKVSWYQGTKSVTSFVGALGTFASRFGEYKAISNLLFPDATAEFMKVANSRFFQVFSDSKSLAAEIGIDYASTFCGIDDAKRSETPGSTSVFVETASGTYQFVGTIQAEKTTRKIPIICDMNPDEEDAKEEPLICSGTQVCKEDQFCYESESAEEPAEGYFYKITWGVTAPVDEKQTPYVDENGKAVRFNIQLQGGINKWLFKRGKVQDTNTIVLDNGASDGGVIVKYLTENYESVCIKFHSKYHVIDVRADEHILELCADFIENDRDYGDYNSESSDESYSSSSEEVEITI